MNFKVGPDTWFIFCILFIGALALLILAYVTIPYMIRKRHSRRREAKGALRDGISRELDGRYTEGRIRNLQESNQKLKTDLRYYLNNALQAKDGGNYLTAFFVDFEKLYPDFGHSLQRVIPKITANELKLAALLRLNLSAKEIAQLLNISPESVNKARYRLRKKIGLDSRDDLFIFLSNI